MLNIKTLDQEGLPRRGIDIQLPENLVPRAQVRFLISRLKSSQIELISGPRRGGKTTVLFQLIQDLINQGFDRDRIIYINCEWFKDHNVLKDPFLFLENIRSAKKITERLFLFFEGLDHISSPIQFLSQLQEQEKNLKIVATTSVLPSEELKDNIRQTNVYPFNLVDWVGFHDSQIVTESRKRIYHESGQQSIHELKIMEKQCGLKLKELFYEIALFGGYPEVLLNPREEWWAKLEEIFLATIKEEYLEKLGIDKASLVTGLLKTLSHEVGELINYSELSDLLKASHITVKKYHSLLADFFLVRSLLPLSGKKKNEISKAHKTFITDPGMMNFIIGQRGNHIYNVDAHTIKNMLFSEFIKNLNYKSRSYFWQTNTGTSVDFVIESGKNFFVPIEIKPGEARPKKLTRSFHSFIKTYKPERAIFVNESLIDYYRVGDTEVLYLPYYWIPLLEGLWQ